MSSSKPPVKAPFGRLNNYHFITGHVKVQIVMGIYIYIYGPPVG